MKAWETDKKQGLRIGAALVAVAVLIVVGLVILAASRQVDIWTFIIGLAIVACLAVLGLLFFWLHGLARSGYALDRNALVIRWGATRQIIPTGQIERVLAAADLEGPVRFRGGKWPGHCVGYGSVPGAGPALFYATAPTGDQILVVTPGLTYGISPADPERFLKTLRQGQKMGPTRRVEQSSSRAGFLEWTIWQDRFGLALLGVGFLAILILTGLLCLWYPNLPLHLTLHWDAAGAPDRWGGRGHLFFVPLLGWLAVLANAVLGSAVHRNERMASYLLWGGSIVVQILVGGAALGIVGQA